MEPMDRFTFFKSYKDSIDKMPEEKRLTFLDALCDYAFYGIEPDMEWGLQAAFENARPNLNNSKACIENGRKGGRPAKKTSDDGAEKVDEENPPKTPLKPPSKGGLSSSISIPSSIPPSSSDSDSISSSFPDIVEAWNSVGLSRVVTLSETRKDKLRLRIKETSAEFIIETIRMIPSSEFLMGKNDNGWKADFDWLIANDTNLLKVSEGKYGGKKPSDIPFLDSIISRKLAVIATEPVEVRNVQ